ncbi:unnamed protein product, partial [Rotaria sp. Silwood1]
SSTLCQLCHEKYPCDEIYFQRNTDIPIRRTQVLDIICSSERETTTYKVISIGKPDDRLFDTIPKNWAYDCQDVTLGIRYNSQLSTIGLKKSAIVEIWLSTPPHRIHDNDTVIIEWQPSSVFNCMDCATWTPERLVFNSTNFDKRQELVITRVKVGEVVLLPILHGGGYDKILSAGYPIYIE